MDWLVRRDESEEDAARSEGIATREQQNAELQHKIDAEAMVVLSFLLVVTVLLMWLCKRRRVRGIHETGLSMLLGMLAGYFVDLYQKRNGDAGADRSNYCNADLRADESSNSSEVITSLEDEATFDPEIFFFVLLPPIIFFAGFDLKQKHFFRNITAILTYAFAGTTIATFITGGMLYTYTSSIADDKLVQQLEFMDCLSFGAFISATDPVTVLAIYHDLHVDDTLFALVFGESVMNDAVALVLFSTIERMKVQQPTFASGMEAVGVFMVIFFGSFACGSLIGMLTALLMKFTKIQEFPLLETTLFVLLSYMTFLIGEAVGLSGIVAVLFCGITQANYTYPNLSLESQVRTRRFFELLNLMAENFIFSYIGLSFFTFKCHHWKPGFISWSILTILVARAAIVYPLSGLMNMARGKKNRIPLSFQHCLWFAGLRGAIAFALAMQNTSTPERQMILSTTLVIVCVTVLFFGGGTVTVLQVFRIRVGVTDEPAVVSPRERRRIEARKSCFARFWQGFDKRYLKPVFTTTDDDFGTRTCTEVGNTIMACLGLASATPAHRPIEPTAVDEGPDDDSDSGSVASSELMDFDEDDEGNVFDGDIGSSTTVVDSATDKYFSKFEPMAGEGSSV